MSSGRRERIRADLRWMRQRAWAACILLLGLLLFVWPFVRTPPLSIGLTYAHLLASWAALTLGLFGMARDLGERDEGGDA